MRKIAVICFFFCILAMQVNAETLPVFDGFNFADEHEVVSEGYSVNKQSQNDDFFVSIENEKMIMHTPTAEYYWLSASKSISSVYSGMLYIEYTLNVPTGNTLMVLRGLPQIEDDSGNTQALIKAMGLNNLTIEGNRISDLSLTANHNYKLRFAIDYDKKEYRLYVDSGSGYEMKHTANGQTSFAYNIGAVSAIRFCIESIPNVENKITIDDVRIYTDQKYFYASPMGNDANDGSIDSPFESVDKAVQNAMEYEGKAAVKLFSGTYNISNEYYLGVADINDTPNIVTVSPITGEIVKYTGDYEVGELPFVIEDNEFVDKFYNDIKNNVAQDNSTEPIKVLDPVFCDEEGNIIDDFKSSSVFVKFNVVNRNVADEQAVMLLLFYNADGDFVGVEICNIEAEGNDITEISKKINVPEEFSGNGDIKILLWNNLKDITPLKKAKFARSVKVSSHGSVKNVNADFSEGGFLLCSGIANNNSMITLKITTSNGEVVYLNQIKADKQGDFELLCNLKGLSVAEHYFSVYATQ